MPHPRSGFLAAFCLLASSAAPIARAQPIPLSQFAIFSPGLLEFTWCAPMVLNGRIYSNGSIYTGSASSLTFNGPVSAVGAIASPSWAGHPASAYTGMVTFNAGAVTNAAPLLACPAMTNLHAMLDMPPAGESPLSSPASPRIIACSSRWRAWAGSHTSCSPPATWSIG